MDLNPHGPGDTSRCAHDSITPSTQPLPILNRFPLQVILTGGSAKIPRLQQLVGDAFPKADLLCSLPPDEALAAGASTEAALLLGQQIQASADASLVPALATSVFCMVCSCL